MQHLYICNQSTRQKTLNRPQSRDSEGRADSINEPLGLNHFSYAFSETAREKGQSNDKQHWTEYGKTFRVRLTSFGEGDSENDWAAQCGSAKSALRNKRCANCRSEHRAAEGAEAAEEAAAGAEVSCTGARFGLQ